MDGGRKRVRFSYDEPDPDDGHHKEKKARFPKGKKESQRVDKELSALLEAEGLENVIKSTDPRVAATERAGRRSLAVDCLDETSIPIPTDVFGAEEDYQGDDDEEEDGISMEPFNLKQEREEGYFDEHGNYVEYRNNDVKDAWLDSAEVDTSLAAKHLKQYTEEEVELSLSSKDLAAIKRRIADALQPGETVLKALRRLKSSSTEKDRHFRAKMSSRTKETFDMLTEDAVKLMDHGEYNVYQEKKETFEREAEGYESLERAQLQACGMSSHAEASTGNNIFGGENLSLLDPEQKDATSSEEKKLSNDTYGSDGNLGLQNSTQASMDMFAEDDDNVTESKDTQGEDLQTDTGYVFDETSGYYYNSTLGYYYDGNTGLFCSAVSGKWFKFDEDTSSYTEIVEDVAEHQSSVVPQSIES